jgi:serine/threonine protein kinase/tetratricopeptide (TPR) repeat protein
MADIEIPGYELYEQLGRGGMATVYRALHLNLDREVAIKVMDRGSSSDDSFSERFIREARISARLIHPHILQIYDVNSHDGHNYIAMEFLGGGDLAGLIRGAMPQRVIYNLMKQMTDALDYASSKGYVHRDIKPSNILLRSADDYVLADFGIAKAADSGTQMTQTGLMVGTPSYMSPEQARGIEVDGRSDLYGMAVLCYEMLTKELPFDADSAVSIAVKHLTADIPTLPEHLAAYQPFINKALAKEPDERFQTGSEMFAAFSEVRGQFNDDDVLTEAKERPAPDPEDEDATSVEIGAVGSGASWTDPTQVSQSSRPSRPYKLSETSSRRERLVTGEYKAAKKGKSASGGAGGLVKGLLLLAVLGGAGFGGYTYWQTTQDESDASVERMSKDLSRAFTAMNEDELDKAAKAFARVLEIEPTNAAAIKGMADIEALRKADRKTRADAVVARAQQEIAKLADDPTRSDAAVTLLQEALQIDAGNEAASEGLDQLAQFHLSAANAAIAAGNFALAGSALANAEDIAPARSDIKELITALPEKEAQWMAAQDIGELTASAAAAAKAGDFASAADQYAVVLKIEPDNAAAQAGFQEAVDGLLNRARANSDDGDFDAASKDLAQALRIDPGRQDVAALQQQLPEIEAAWNQQNKVAARLAEANGLYKKGDFSTAADVYIEVLELDPESKQAEQGLSDAMASLINAAQKSADKGDFDTARENIASALKLDAESVAANELSDELPALEKAWKQRKAAEAQRVQVAREAAAKGSIAIRDGDLQTARQVYDEVSTEYPTLASTGKLKGELLNAYITATRAQIDVEEYDLAYNLIEAGRSISPEREEWLLLEDEIDNAKTKSRRRLGGF